MALKHILKAWVPPALVNLFRKPSPYGFSSSYATWGEACREARGYDDPVILEKVTAAALMVKRGEAAFERDSVPFKRKEYAWPLLGGLLWSATRNNNRLRVLDFGGSLGSTYVQHRDFLEHLDLSWNVVEQPSFVARGKELFADEKLHFFSTIEECLEKTPIDLLLISSTLQYLEDPYAFMEKALGFGFDTILIDRTPFLKNEDRITVQKVRPEIYDASYPAHLMNETRFLTLFKGQYDLVAEHSALFGLVELKGYLFKKKA